MFINTNTIDKGLTAKNILRECSQYDIYSYYLGFDFKYNKLYPSPFRYEINGSFGIKCYPDGTLMHKDFGMVNYHGNCFQFVQQLFGLDFNQALNKINKDLGLGLMSTIKGYESDVSKKITNKEQPKIPEIYKTEISVIARDFTSEDMKFWNQYHLNEDDLKLERIYSVKELYINGTLIKPSCVDDEMRFAYLYTDEEGENYIKIYSPFSKNYKWISNVPVTQPLNFKHLPISSKNVIVIKSKKDKLVVKKIFPDLYEVQKEGTECIVPELDSFFDENYDHKFCFFDNDEPGKNANRQLNPLGYGWVNIPNYYRNYSVKDPSDLVKYLGKEKGYEKLREILNQKGII